MPATYRRLGTRKAKIKYTANNVRRKLYAMQRTIESCAANDEDKTYACPLKAGDYPLGTKDSNHEERQYCNTQQEQLHIAKRSTCCEIDSSQCPSSINRMCICHKVTSIKYVVRYTGFKGIRV